MEQSNSLKKEIFHTFWPLLVATIMNSALGIVDTIMIATCGDSAVAGISAINQYTFLVMPVCFAILTAFGTFFSQAFGAGDNQKMRSIFSLSMFLMLMFGVFNLVGILLFDEQLLRFYVGGDAQAIEYGLEYSKYFAFSALIYPLSFGIGNMLRRYKKAKISMYINVGMVVLNSLLNYLLIFGNFGFPELGVSGAAIATVISRLAALIAFTIALLVIKPEFKATLRKPFDIDKLLLKKIIIFAIPLVISEFLFGLGRSTYSKAYSMISVESFTASKVSFQVQMFMNAFVMAAANTVSIILGIKLGQISDKDELKKISKTLVRFLGIISIFVFTVTLFILPLFVVFFRLEQPTHDMTVALVRIYAIYLAFRAFSSGITFMLRSGGDSTFALIIDSGITWLIGLPLTFIFVFNFSDNFTAIDATKIIAYISVLEMIVKIVISFVRFRQEKYLKKLI